VLALYERHAGDLGPAQWLELFESHGIPRAKVEAALAYDPDGRGTLRDRMAADMTNRVLAELGVAARRTAADVRRLREREGSDVSTTRPTTDFRPPRPDR